jgi:hypothetical protein
MVFDICTKLTPIWMGDHVFGKGYGLLLASRGVASKHTPYNADI